MPQEKKAASPLHHSSSCFTAVNHMAVLSMHPLLCPTLSFGELLLLLTCPKKGIAVSVMFSINAAESVSIVRASKISSRVAHQKHGLQMLLLPRWSITHRLMKGYTVFLPLSVVYIVLLARSWTPDMLQLMMPGSLDAGLSG